MKTDIIHEAWHQTNRSEAEDLLKDAKEKFGNWTLCAAAYNMGMGGVEAHMKKQPSKSYYDLMMNKETSFYIYRILALKTVFINSGKKFHAGGRSNRDPGRPYHRLTAGFVPQYSYYSRRPLQD